MNTSDSRFDLNADAGHAFTASREFLKFCANQLQDGCTDVALVAGIVMALDEAAKEESGASFLRTAIATLLKAHAR